jgi:hypothetical protein
MHEAMLYGECGREDLKLVFEECATEIESILTILFHRCRILHFKREAFYRVVSGLCKKGLIAPLFVHHHTTVMMT